MDLISPEKCVNKYLITSAPPKSTMLSVTVPTLVSFVADVSYLGALNEKGGLIHGSHVIFHVI